jgi:ATP-dependent DNA helicase RecG
MTRRAKPRRGEGAPEPPAEFATGKRQTRETLLGTDLHWLRPALLERSLDQLAGVGPATARAAGRLRIATVADLLEHLPARHRDYERRRRISELAVGEEATIAVTVRACRVRPTRRRRLRLLECDVADESGALTAIWFNQEYLADQLKAGVEVLLRGKFERARGGPAFRVLEHELVTVGRGDRVEAAVRHTTGLVPVYPATEGLSSRRIRELAWRAMRLLRHVTEPLPARLLSAEQLPIRRDALAAAHLPRSLEDAEIARRRLAFEELYLLQVALIARRRARRGTRKAELISEPGELVEDWLASLGFELTSDQLGAVADIDRDIDGERPMQRLLMGEVGSGKTVVALFAMLRAAEVGKQAALMAPTETLAEQHYRTIERLVPQTLFAGAEVTKLGLPVGLLTGSTPAGERRELLERLGTGELRLLVGTHALIEEQVDFDRLALVVVDEQHRFGVHQRTALDQKARGGLVPHVLHLTATPIPRTLALTLYGDLDASVLRQLPAGRHPVATWVVPEEKRSGAYEFIRERLREGRQCFVVCPLVEESVNLQARAATHEGERLAAGEFRDFRVEVMHGQMPAARKREVMARFVEGSVDVLVATSVIEVGIDVANATVMLIEEADRYGISQLHQLRGRVGRGAHESQCLLFGGSAGELARKRLDAVARERDGFRLAEVDLELRGEGELLGTKQSGLPEFKVARLPEDLMLLERARERAQELIRADADVSLPEHAPLADAILARFYAGEPARIAA